MTKKLTKKTSKKKITKKSLRMKKKHFLNIDLNTITQFRIKIQKIFDLIKDKTCRKRLGLRRESSKQKGIKLSKEKIRGNLDKKAIKARKIGNHLKKQVQIKKT